MVLTSPLGKDALIVCKLGKNRRRVIPVIFVPTPPKYLALPRVSIILPTWGDLLQTSQALAMTRPDFQNRLKRPKQPCHAQLGRFRERKYRLDPLKINAKTISEATFGLPF
jgi:hypothetical protein